MSEMALLIIKLIIDILLLIASCILIIKVTCQKKTDKKYGQYPCNDYLNNALRFLLGEEQYTPRIINAISEICYCISKAGGRYYDDVAKKLAETGLCPFIEKKEAKE